MTQQEVDFERARLEIIRWARLEDIAKHESMMLRFLRKARPVLCMLGGGLVAGALLGLMLRLI
jgi:hypothetical protein